MPQELARRLSPQHADSRQVEKFHGGEAVQNDQEVVEFERWFHHVEFGGRDTRTTHTFGVRCYLLRAHDKTFRSHHVRLAVTHHKDAPTDALLTPGTRSWPCPPHTP